MADRKISELTALTTPATGDLIPIVDISEVAAADKNKSITVGELLRGAPDGTAAAPGFAFESDGGNGMFLGGTDILAFSTGGTQAVTIDASQRVGLGSSSPDANSRLHIVGSSYQPLYVNTTSANGGGAVFLQQGTQTLYTGTAGSSWLSGSTATDGLVRAEANLILATNGNTRAVTIDSSQRLGVGTSSPAFRTEIVDTLQADANLHYSLVVRGDDSGTDGESAQIFLSAINATSRGAAIAAVRKTGSNDHDLVFKTSAASATPTERARITSDGELGLGTSLPSSRLTVVDSSSNTAGAAGAFIDINNTDANASVVSGLRFKNGTTDSYKGAIYFKDTAGDARGDLVFATNDVASGATEVGLSDARMTITRTGNVLVGTTTTSLSSTGIILGYQGDTYCSIPSGNTLHVYSNTGSAYRFYVNENGGISNYSANNVNLCDEREKKNIETLDSTWDCLKDWELKKFHYNEDADTDDKRYGVIAQQVAPHCPEVISQWIKQPAQDAVLDDDGNVVTPATEEVTRMGVKEHQMMWMAIKALQEAQTRIETLEQRLSDAGIA